MSKRSVMRLHIVKTKCHHCGAILDVNDESETLYCRYCGRNLLLEFSERASSKTKAGDGTPSNVALTWSRTQLGRIGTTIVVYLIFSSIFGIIFTCASCMGGVVENGKLESLERRIQDDIDSQDYESAYLNTKELEPSSSASSEKKEYWTQKRTDYQDKIIELKRERDSSDPSYIPAPESSEDLLGRSYESVVRRFEESGFTNVKTVAESLPRTRKVPTGRHGRTRTEVLPTPIFFNWTRGSVSKIEFGCLTSFTIEDHCRPDEEIVIHYHADGNEPIVIPAPTPPEVTFDPDLTFERVPDDQS